MKPFIVFLCAKVPGYNELPMYSKNDDDPDDPYIAVTFTSDFSIANVASTSMSPAEVVAYYDTPAVWSTLTQIKAVVGNGFIYMETPCTGVSVEPGHLAYYYTATPETHNIHVVSMSPEMWGVFCEKESDNDETGN